MDNLNIDGIRYANTNRFQAIINVVNMPIRICVRPFFGSYVLMIAQTKLLYCYILKKNLVFVCRKSLSLWQLSYDDTFIQMIYSLDNDLLDCEYLKGRNFAEEFVQKFYDEIERAKHLHKFSVSIFTLPKIRHRIHRNVSKVDIAMNSDDEIFGMKNISYRPLNTMNDVPDDLAVILNYENLKTQCDNNHRQMMQIIDDSQSKDQIKQINATNHLNR